MSASGPTRVNLTDFEKQTFPLLSLRLLKQEITLQDVVDLLDKDKPTFDRFMSYHQRQCARIKLAKINQQIKDHETEIERVSQIKIDSEQIIEEREANIPQRNQHYTKALRNLIESSSSPENSGIGDLANCVSEINLNRQSATTAISSLKTAAAKTTNIPAVQAQRTSSASVSTTTFITPTVAAAASSNNTAPPPQQSAAPKLQLPPLPGTPLRPKAPSAQARTATSSALPSTLTASTANFSEACNQSKKYPARVYEYYRPKGYSDNEVDTFLSILQYIGEGNVTEAKQLASNLDDSDKAKLARFREDQRTYQELQEKQIAEMAKLENELHKINLKQQEIKDALSETQDRKEALINKASLEIAVSLKDFTFPSGKKHFEGKSLEQIAAFIKDLIITKRELYAKMQSLNESKATSLENIHNLEILKGSILERLQAEESQSASSAAAASSNPVFRPSQPSAPAVAKSSAAKKPSLAQPKLKPMSSAASAAAAAAGNSSMAASSVKPTNTALQTQRASSAAVSTAAFTMPAVVTAASSNNAALPPRQSATPKLQTPPLPSANPLKPRAPAAQIRALPSTLAAKAAASSTSTNSATQLDIDDPPAYLVQAKASAKPAISKAKAKQAPMTAPRPLPPTPGHAMTTRTSAISAPGPARNGTRPSK